MNLDILRLELKFTLMESRIITTVFYLFALTFISFSQSFQWVQSLPSTQNGDLCPSGDGNILRCGTFSGTVDFDDSGDNVEGLSYGGADIFVQKFDDNGSLLWLKTIGGTGTDEAYSIRVDDNMNIYIGGFYSSTVDFDPGVGVANKTATGRDAFVLKLDSNGDFVWVETFESTGNTYIHFLEIRNGSAYFAGYCDGQIDLDPSPSDSLVTTNGQYNLFMGKMDLQGSLDWAHTIDGSGEVILYGFDVDNDGNPLFSGDFFDVAIDLDPSSAQAISPCNGDADVFLLKLDSEGNYLWHNTFGGVGFDFGVEVYVDGDNNIYQVGAFSGTVDVDPYAGTDNRTSSGERDFFLQKYSPQGSLIRTTTLGISGSSYAEKIQGDGEFLYLTGLFNDTVDLNPDPNIENIYVSYPYIDPTYSDYFVLKLDTAANHIWSGQLTGPMFFSSPELTIGQDGSLYYFGRYDYDFDADPGIGESILTTNGNSSSSTFLLKLGDEIAQVDEFIPNDELVVYPSPFKDQILIQGITQNASFEIVQLNGQVVRKGEMVNGKIDQLEHLPSGSYFLNIFTGNKLYKSKLVK